MRPGIITAVVASLLLVVGASWYRFAHTTYNAPMLAIEQKAQQDAANDNFYKNFLSTASSTSVAPPQEKLTTTDLMSRQLMTDYFNLSGNGQATEANIAALGDHYAENLPSLAPAPHITLGEIRIVPDSQGSFNTYAVALRNIYLSYEKTLSQNAFTPPEGNVVTKKEYTFMKNAGLSYEKQAHMLEGLAVPASLAEAHVKLINANLANATALKAIGDAETDPAVGMAGLAQMTESIDAETAAFAEISGIIRQNPNGM